MGRVSLARRRGETQPAQNLRDVKDVKVMHLNPQLVRIMCNDRVIVARRLDGKD